jgi:hypothetical protein
VRLLDGERLVSFGRDAELIVWDLRRAVMLARHDRRGVIDVRATGGPDSRLVKPFSGLSGRSWRVGLHELSQGAPGGSPTIVSHSLGLPHRARAVSVTAVARPAHAEVVGGFVWRTAEALRVCLCLFTSSGRRMLWQGVAENPNDKSLFLWVEAIAPDVVRVGVSGVATLPRRHVVSLTTGHLSPWPGEGLTGGGRHLTFDGRLFDLHHGAEIPWPDLAPQRGEERRGEDLSEDGRLALTRAGDTLTWWSCAR